MYNPERVDLQDGHLAGTIIKTVRKVENLDDSVDRHASYLKQKLKPRLSSLLLEQPTRRNHKARPEDSQKNQELQIIADALNSTFMHLPQ